MGLYAEWKKLRDNVRSASARVYSEKNENTERKYDEALERLCQFEKENGIPLMADEDKGQEQTNFEFMRSCTMDEMVQAIYDCTMANSWNFSKNGIKRWLKQPHTKEGTK